MLSSQSAEMNTVFGLGHLRRAQSQIANFFILRHPHYDISVNVPILSEQLFDFTTCVNEPGYVADNWRRDYNHYRPHSSLGYMTPAGFLQLCRQAG